jgi:hypothetical protein
MFCARPLSPPAPQRPIEEPVDVIGRALAFDRRS